MIPAGSGAGSDRPGGAAGVARAARVAVLVGSIGSLAFMLAAGRHSPRLLLVAIGLWVISPFMALVVAERMSTRWSPLTRRALHVVTIVIAVGALSAYAVDTVRPPHPQAAFMYVAVAPLAWLFALVVVGAAALISRGRAVHGDGA
ncbi:MAG: hypothetical protein NVS1B4_26170 [Gemmatimonadaceae bacterium]